MNNDLWQRVQHEQPLCPRCQPGVSHLVSQVGQRLVHLEEHNLYVYLNIYNHIDKLRLHIVRLGKNLGSYLGGPFGSFTAF